MIETVVESIRVNLVTQNRVVILKEVGGDRHLPIWIGEFEAQAIMIELRKQTAPRPLPYDLLRATIDSLGGVVQNVSVSDLSQDIFYARIVIEHQGQRVEIDSRPSDAIALALRARCPILVDERVMEHAGVSLEDEEGDVATTDDTGSTTPPSPESTASADDRLSAFRDFIDTLDLEDFGKNR
jgi:bifunctional DNase/RNase